jgi:hypothetical protein
MSILLLVTQTLLHRILLRFIQFFVGELDLWLTRRQLGPLQRMERVFRKENLPYERAGEDRILTLERAQDQIRTGGFCTGELILANGDDRFDLGGELGVRGDFDGFALNLANVALEFPLVGLEPDML